MDLGREEISRRTALGALAAAPLVLAAGCHTQAPRLLPAGEIVGANVNLGHRVRSGSPFPQPTRAPQQTGVVIIGAGVAGLTAAWQLKRSGYHDFLVLELESAIGGTARSGTSGVAPYPWGAHYLPAPMAENKPLLALLEEMNVVTGYSPAGEPIFAEEHLCRDPEERLFVAGEWHEGLFPEAVATADDLAEWQRFLREVNRWVTWRDAEGRRAFALPAANSSTAEEVAQLDRITMSEWLAQRQFRSPVVHWMVDYACRDDYGCTAEYTSAWAGLFYFASRVPRAGAAAEPLLTWPEGNGRLVAHLAERVKSHLQTGQAVLEVNSHTGPENDAVEVLAWNEAQHEAVAIRSRAAIFAAPQFVAPHAIRGYREARGADAQQFTYGSWLVANLHLSARPKENGFSPAWDSVLYESDGLGYVMATHQLGRDYGPTVLTYYYPFCEADFRAARQRLLELDWQAAANLVLTDLEQAHPEIRTLVERLDVMLWGHAMIRPVPGFRFGTARTNCTAPFHNVHFCHSDLSGLALFEEAFYHGERAAEEVLRRVKSEE